MTRYVQDLLPTIVSRSQCFFVPSQNQVIYDYSSIKGIFEHYWEFKRSEVFDISQKLLDAEKEFGVNQILDGIQNYILEILKENPDNIGFIEHIQVLENAKKQARLGVKTINIFDDVCLKLIK